MSIDFPLSIPLFLLIALEKINTVQNRIRLAFELKVTEQTIVNNIKINRENNILTTVAALKVLREITELKDEEILLEVTAEVGN